MPEGVRAAEELPTREVEEVTAREVLEGRCGACHAGEEASGGLAIVDEEGELKEKLPRQRMWEAIEAGRMPRGEQKMSAEELELLREWVRPPKELEW
jgi:mono/diheme cytochrome c family protein